MKLRLRILFSILAVLLPMLLSAQEYEVEITATNKTIWVSKLPLPPNMTVFDFLMTIPELINGSSDSFLERYNIQLDGKIIDDSRDAFLQNTCLREVEKIVISNSPENTHINNGFSGSINIVPLPIKKGFSGDVVAQTVIGSSILPTANLRYSDGQRFEVRVDLDLDLSRFTKQVLSETVGKGYSITSVDTTRSKYLGQLARIYAKWKISDKDVLKVWFWQNYMSTGTTAFSTSTRIDDKSDIYGPGWQFSNTERSSSTSSARRLDFNAIIDYSRTMDKGDFKANADYHSYNSYPGKKDELNMELKWISKFNFADRKLNLEAAVNFSSNSNRGRLDNMHYFSPILKLDYKGKKVKAVLSGRYKGFLRNYCPEGGSPYSGWAQDWTAEAKVLWQIADHHALRFMLVRNAGVASNNLVYPETIYDGASKMWRRGNPKLLGPETGSANITYITDWKKGPHSFIVNVSAEMNRRNRVIENSVRFDSSRGVPYVYPVNISFGDVFGLSAMLNYSYGPFYMTVGGNVFRNLKYSLYNERRAGYFNLSFAPSIQLKGNWLINAGYLYNSKVVTDNAEQGDCSLLSLRVCKSLNNWTFFAAIQDVFDGLSVDVESGYENIYRTYDPYPRLVEIGASIHF